MLIVMHIVSMSGNKQSASRKTENYFSKYGVIWKEEDNPTW